MHNRFAVFYDRSTRWNKRIHQRTPEFVICIALIDNNYPIFGLIYAPVTQEIWISTQLTPQPLYKKNIAFVSRSHIDQQTHDYIEKNNLVPLPCGSALKFGYMVDGKAEIYPRFGPTCPWDIAAGQAILEAAGGKVLDLKGNRVRYTGEKNERLPYFIASREH